MVINVSETCKTCETSNLKLAVTDKWNPRCAEAMRSELQFPESAEEGPNRLHIPVRGSRPREKYADTLQVHPCRVTPTELSPGVAGLTPDRTVTF